MRAILKRLAIAGLAGLVLLEPLAARADVDDDGDHDRARDLYEHGEIKGLADILDLVRAKAPGDIVAVDLIRKADRWVYQFQVVGADGRRRTVEVDAGAGVIMRDGEGD
ncbi:PepSY domain-containing protein [Mesorhizobium sp. ES1-1]|uniref:PepSY domain-containing protein n=1 Tax=Mesorhizobium sp. ES1-1 TaxID=2876629 RepID=UPI001CCF39C6|nr:PepSY domain-containing protein [Mesorhizobium sp. ES1-1]MBZ9676180.1 PepSY domain-containing protein [Mesorhizobium sp. ES1-1]